MVRATGGYLAVDTSVAIPLLVATHEQHGPVMQWRRGRRVALGGHALVETYSVLTRLPGDLRLAPPDAVRLLDRAFGHRFELPPEDTERIPEQLAELGIAGGAVYDAVVAVAALRAGLPLATRDARAAGTYRRVGVEVMLLG